MKKGRKVTLLILAVLVILIAAGVPTISIKMKELDKFLEEVKIEPVDLDQVTDGTYAGETDAGIIQVRLEVDVRDHRITEIRLLKHQNGQGAPAEQLLVRMIEEQRVDLDAISGATYSSLAIENAVGSALSR